MKYVPQVAHSPSVSPGSPSRERPTSAPQLLQNRLFSLTTGSLSTAAAGSLTGTTGTSTRPAPSRPRPDVREPVRRPVLGKELEPVVCGLSGFSPACVGGGESGLRGGAGGGSTLSVMGVSSSTLVGSGSSGASAVAGLTPGCRGATLGTGTPGAHCMPGDGCAAGRGAA